MNKILVTNDDGIDAVGIRALTKALSELAEVYVVAPAEEQSAKSQGITFLHPVKVEEREISGAAAAYAAWGTPTDCIKIGLSILKKQGIKPDYVFSGINLGYNTGLAAYYSGTVAAAREGALNGIRSIALSTGNHEASEFEYLLGLLPVLMDMSDSIEPDTLLSVNAPDLPADKIKGYMVAETAPFGYGLYFTFVEATEGLYQMTDEPGISGDGSTYDMDANAAGYVAISPIPTSMSDGKSLSKLRGRDNEHKILNSK